MLHWIAFGINIVCWVVFGGLFLFRKRPTEPTTDRKMDPKSRFGLPIQCIAYCFAWWARPFDMPFVMAPVVGMIFPVIAIFLPIWSVNLVHSAIKELGKQWAIRARIIEGHELIMSGPYAIVRHPIYTGMFGLLISTGLVLTTWYVLLFAILLMWIGTNIRIKAEEKLLFDTFDKRYLDYASKVPALFPKRLFSR